MESCQLFRVSQIAGFSSPSSSSSSAFPSCFSTDRLSGVDVLHYSYLLDAYSSEGDYKKADELVQNMKSAGLVPNKVMLTTLLKVYVRGGLFEKAKELLAELEDFDGYAYSIMISAFCRAGLLDEAKLLAIDFEASSEKFDVVILNTMLCAYCRAGEMDSVMQTMKKMDEFSISPDINTFQILIKYFIKEKLYMLAYQTVNDMHSKGYQPAERESLEAQEDNKDSVASC
ncbi:hypothetical protein QQ045_017636 [Rhodiola kirilowii]